MTNVKLPELLAPAGTPDALAAAIEGGADAAYFGSTDFSCRMRAGNFDADAMRDALSLCRAYGVKSYITVNTRLRDGELNDVLRLIDNVYGWGASAIIATDLALVSAVREKYPDLELHASTQVSGATADDARALAKLGFSRMVCPRELSREQIARLVSDSPIGIEMFIHGAHCASFSGQCLASFAMGGRSGNRGECAQPCRLAYTDGGKLGYPLSLKDMCLAGHIEDIIKSGVASLKIEGRQKSPGYVYGVTKIYRKLLDEGRNATPDEIEQLSRLFSRDGFTDGYFTKKLTNMTGVRTKADADVSREAESFAKLTKKASLDVRFTARAGEKLSLTLTRGGASVTVLGEIPGAAMNRPLDCEAAQKNLCRFGGTPYECGKFFADIDGGLWVTPAQLNALRRDALTQLDDVLLQAARAEARKKSSSVSGEAYVGEEKLSEDRKKLWRTAEFLTLSQIPEEAYGFFDEIYVPASEYVLGKGLGVILPPAILDPDGFPEAAVKDAKAVMAHSMGQISRALDCGAKVTASMRMNVFNTGAAKELKRLGCVAVCASPELPLGAMRAIGDTAVVYGRLPLMLLMRCMRTGESSCKKDELSSTGLCKKILTDRKGAKFPVIGSAGCVNVMYNSVPVYMADKAEDISSLVGHHFIFTTESAVEVAEIIRAYRFGTAPKDSTSIRRLK